MGRRIPFADMVAESPFGAGLGANERQAMMAWLRPRPFSAGEILISAGELDRRLFLLLAGEVGVSAHAGGNDFALMSLGPGDMVGEICFFDAQARRSADVIASKRGLAAGLQYSDLLVAQREGHPLVATLQGLALAQLTKRLNAADRLLAGLATHRRPPGLVRRLRGSLGLPS